MNKKISLSKLLLTNSLSSLTLKIKFNVLNEYPVNKFKFYYFINTQFE